MPSLSGGSSFSRLVKPTVPHSEPRARRIHRAITLSPRAHAHTSTPSNSALLAMPRNRPRCTWIERPPIPTRTPPTRPQTLRPCRRCIRPGVMPDRNHSVPVPCTGFGRIARWRRPGHHHSASASGGRRSGGSGNSSLASGCLSWSVPITADCGTLEWECRPRLFTPSCGWGRFELWSIVQIRSTTMNQAHVEERRDRQDDLGV